MFSVRTTLFGCWRTLPSTRLHVPCTTCTTAGERSTSAPQWINLSTSWQKKSTITETLVHFHSFFGLVLSVATGDNRY